MNSKLFSPLQIGPVELPNRIAVAPMCQYSGHDGVPDPDWHTQNLMNLAMTGAGLVMIEATAVERLGRITHGCTGLWSDDTQAGMARMVASARRVALPGTRIGIQLGHAGRKASAQRPWEGGRALSPAEDPWGTISASALPFEASWHTPKAMDEADIERVQTAFANSARRAVAIGLDAIEMHAAHGYLLHQFTSPLSNQRTDRYGGSLENRLRMPLEIARRMREAVPKSVVLGARITGTDWVGNGVTPEEAVQFARGLKDAGFDYVCVSSGGISLGISIPVAANYQVHLAEKIKREVGIVTRAVGMIVQPDQAEEILAAGQADQVAMARAFLDNPRWVWHAAQKFGAEFSYPPQYDRVRAKGWPGAALLRPVAP